MRKALSILLLGSALPFATLARPPFPYGPIGPVGPGPAFLRGPAEPIALYLRRETRPDAYKAIIELRGITPKQVQVSTHGRMVEISTQAEDQTDEEKTGAAGYYRYFSYRSNRLRRRFSVPGDADLGAMQREDGEDRITLTIPRRSAR